MTIPILLLLGTVLVGLVLFALEIVPTDVLCYEPGSVRDDGPPETSRVLRVMPNPFTPEARISFAMVRSGSVRISVYAVTGRLVTTLVSGFRDAGTHAVTWNACDDHGRRVSSGSYFCLLESGDTGEMRLMTLLE